MKYLNLSSSINQEPEMICASHEQKGIWLDLICYCTTHMNNGIILACDKWPDSIWQRITGTTAAAIHQESPLWSFSGMNLIVHFYDAKSEADYIAKRRKGREHALKRWKNNHSQPPQNQRLHG